MATSKQIKALITRLDGKIKKLTQELGEAKKRKVQLSADLKKAVAEEKEKAAPAKAKKNPVVKKKPAAKKKQAAQKK